jgi:hypothetical protein
MPVTPGFGRLRQEDCMFKAILGNIPTRHLKKKNSYFKKRKHKAKSKQILHQAMKLFRNK